MGQRKNIQPLGCKSELGRISEQLLPIKFHIAKRMPHNLQEFTFPNFTQFLACFSFHYVWGSDRVQRKPIINSQYFDQTKTGSKI